MKTSLEICHLAPHRLLEPGGVERRGIEDRFGPGHQVGDQVARAGADAEAVARETRSQNEPGNLWQLVLIRVKRLEHWLQTAVMREAGQPAVRLTRGNAREAAYWTPAQLVAHHSAGGCNLQPGDLFGSGTLSGPAPDQAGSMLELTQGGKQPITLPNGETRSFLADGDALTLRAVCERAGVRRIGFGECSATVMPAPAVPT